MVRIYATPMDPALTQLILQDHKIGYALTTADLTIREMGGAEEVLFPDQPLVDGGSLLKLSPELIGSEDVLADILSGNLDRFQLSLVNRDTPAGRRRYLTLVCLPYQDQAGQINGLLYLAEDVTELGEFEQRLTQQHNELRLLQEQMAHQNLKLAAANAELRHLDEMKSTFASIAVHELRTPLTLIVGFLEVLQDEEVGPLTEAQRDYLNIVSRNNARLSYLIDDLLDVTRIETGRLELQLKPINLGRLLTITAAEFERSLAEKSHQLNLNLGADLPFALCDESRASQIISNLYSNASKYTPDGGQINVTLTPAPEDGFLQVAVQDNGIGISDEDQAKLFNRFFRARGAAFIGAKGTGLGLYITRILVELHGGRIWFKSKLNQGSTFYVTFPIAGHQTEPAPNN